MIVYRVALRLSSAIMICAGLLAIGAFLGNRSASMSGPAQAAAPTTASIGIAKLPDFQYAHVGQVVRFTIAVTNTGDVDLTEVAVTDPVAPDCDRLIGDLAVGASVTYECSLAVAADLVNQAEVSGKDPEGATVQAGDVAEVDVTPSSYIYDDVPITPTPITSDTVCFSGNQIFRYFDVAESFTVGDVNLGFNADHRYRGDLWVFLISPAGTRAELTTDDIHGPDNHRNFDVMLDDSSPNPLDDGDDDNTAAPYYDRDARPFRPLSVFNGENSQGRWTLEICDKFPVGPKGTYNRSRLVLQDVILTSQKLTEEIIVEPGSAITYTMAVANHGRVVLSELTLSDTIPTGLAFRQGTLTATAGIATETEGVISWSGSVDPGAAVSITYATDVVQPTPGLITNTASVSHDILSVPLSSTVVSQVFTGHDVLYTNEADAPIPDGYTDCLTPVISTITVPDSFYVGDVRVGLTADHTFRGDLEIELWGPTGITVSLLSSAGMDENIDVMVTDTGDENAFELGAHDTAAPYYDVSGRPGGTEDLMRKFDGEPAQGVWTLWICDDAFVDTGTLRRWSLFFKKANVWLGYDSSWHTPTNWSKGVVPDMTDFALILPNPEGGFFPILDGDAAVANLMIKGGATTDLATYGLTVEDYMVNRGTISQTLPVTEVNTPVEFLHITNAAGDVDQYFGAVITPTVSSMGDVRVGIMGNQTGGCTGIASDALLTRCFRIQPTEQSAATVQFYYTEDERNQQDASSLKVWNRGDPPMQWRQVGTNYVSSETGEGCATGGGARCWLQAEGVADPGPLTLGSASPPAVAIRIVDEGIELQWSHTEANVARYEVWRGSHLLFTPGDAGSELLAELPPDDSHAYTWLDSASWLGNADLNGFYVVRTVYTNDQTTDANRVAEMDFSLVGAD